MTNQNDELLQYVLRLADDSIVLGQRLIEWCSNAPFLEEDLCLSNTSLDFIGRAKMLYGYAAEISNDGRSEDDFPFLRDCREYSNGLIYELPRGDFAYTYARQFFVDAYEVAFYEALKNSSDKHLSDIAGKAVKECQYHLRHSREWMLRLGDGTQESHEKLQTAVNSVADFIEELFEQDALVSSLIEKDIAVDPAAVKRQWQELVNEVLVQAKIELPEQDSSWHQTGGRSGGHTEYLGHLLSELQFMQRAYPGLEW
jgi:ring-1,2-phenylacetyl-CoA epoxidase subunit PaaC